MKTKNPILILIENGIQFPTLKNMTKNQIKVLAEKFDKTKIEEQSTIPQNTTPQSVTTTKYLVKPNSKTMINGVEIDTTGGKTTATPMKETEISEKFESKAQQGLFWARCNKCKTKDCKWCKMAKEFSDSTTKKDYKKMPEKKHPEKTVKYKKTQKESYDKELENVIIEMISKHINPKMTKKDITKTISEKSDSMILRNPKKVTMFSDEEGKEMKRMKLPIGKLNSFGRSLGEDTKEKERTKEREKTITPKRRDNPFKNPNPGVKEKPRGMEGDGTKEKERTKERETTKTPTRKNPFKNPNPGVKEKPRGEKEQIKFDFISTIKKALS